MRTVHGGYLVRTHPRHQNMFVSQKPGSNPPISPFSRFTSELASSFSPLFFSLAHVRGEREAKNGGWGWRR